MADNRSIIEAYFASLPAYIAENAAPIVAETAVEVFKENILTGSYDGVPMIPLSTDYKAHKKRNPDKVLYLNGFLFASIRPAEVTPDKVIVSAGSTQVPYARIHNEGLTINTVAQVRQFTRNKYKYSKKGNRKGVSSSTVVKAHTRHIDFTMPKRQYMGYPQNLKDRIISRLQNLIKE